MLLSGSLCKRSEIIKSWNVRLAAVHPSADGSPGTLEWRGGAQPGSIPLDAGCSLAAEGERLVLRRAGREWQFRAAPEGPGIVEWHDAVASALAAAASCAGCR
jgi:hypothetical protein